MATIELIPYRYETPTATLQVTGRSLAISQWSDQPVVQPMRFQLTVHSPDRDPVEISGKQADLIALKTLVQRYLQAVLGPTAQPVTESGLTLAPEGISQHRLTLGPLSSHPAISHLVLSILELSDWVDLFDQLEGQVRCLPVPLSTSSRGSLRQQWRSLAAVFVVSVGTIAVWPYLNRDRPLPTATQAPIEEASPSFDTAEEPATESTENAAVEAEQAAAEAESADTATVDSPDKPETAQPQPKTNEPHRAGTQRRQTQAESQVSPPDSANRDRAPVPQAPSSQPFNARIPEAESARAPQTDHSEDLASDGAAVESAPVSPLAFEDALVAASLPQQWSPPAGFTGVLSYQIMLTVEGRIEAIAPADAQSVEYQAQTGLPAIGTVINDIEPAQTLEITFYEDGTVEITPESP